MSAGLRRIRLSELLIVAVALYVTLWSAVRIWAAQPARECSDHLQCHCICPECPEASR
jgi:hypothetical protein